MILAFAKLCAFSISPVVTRRRRAAEPRFRLGAMIDARDTALIFEGGGMRNSYTAACVSMLLREKVRFGWVGGVSAGASHTVNYLSKDIIRAEESFTDFAHNPSFGGVGSLFRGTGYFNAEFIYEKSADKELPFDWKTFQSNPIDFDIAATRADIGETVHWGREDAKTPADLFMRVRASSTLPLIMPMRVIDSVPYVDGALGETGGISLREAQAAGMKRFLFIGTKPRDYVRPRVSRTTMVRRIFYKNPAIADALIARPARYNASKDALLELEREGSAQLFFPGHMNVASTERNVAKLRANFQAGVDQTEKEWPAWREFLAG